MHKSRILLPLTAGLFLFFHACFPAKKGGKTHPTPNSSSMQLRHKITDFAQKHIGEDYKYGGKNPKSGFDCSGFTHFVLGTYNIKVSPASSMQATEGRKVPLDRVQPGDLVFFGDGKKINHVALVVRRSKDGLFCVHSTTSRGVVLDNITTSSYWQPRLLFARDVISK